MSGYEFKELDSFEFDVELKKHMSEVSNENEILDGSLFDVEETKIYVFRSTKTVTFLKKTKCVSISITSDFMGSNFYDITFINKIKPVKGMSGFIYFLFVAYPNKKDIEELYKKNPIEFIKNLHGELIPGMTSKCVNIDKIVQDFLK